MINKLSLAPDKNGAPSAKEIQRFAALFAGRTRRYGRFFPSGKLRDGDGKVEGRADWTDKNGTEPVTEEVYARHLRGEQSIGIGPMRDDGHTVTFGAIDIDAKNYADFAGTLPLLVAKLGRWCLPVVCCRSKSGGLHGYVFAKEPIEASIMRKRLSGIARALFYPSAEMFPTKDSLDNPEEDSAGFINLPFFGGTENGRYAMKSDGSALTLSEFLDFAEGCQRPAAWFQEPVTINFGHSQADAHSHSHASHGPKAYEGDSSQGNRHNYVWSAMALFMQKNYDATDVVIQAQVDSLLHACDPPFDAPQRRTESKGLFKRACYWREKAVANQPDAKSIYKLTELGNAHRFKDWYEDDFRYNHTTGTWLQWDGASWAKDERGAAEQYMAQLATTLRTCELDRARKEGLAEYEKAIPPWHKRSESYSNIQASLKLASVQRPFAVLHKELDIDDYLLNCRNGTLNLRTGQLREHRQADLITHCCDVDYDPEAWSEEWEHFLKTATQNNEEIVDFLQCAVGYTLTGDVSEEKLFFVHGDGNTGKTTFLEAIGAVMGDYGIVTQFQTVLEKPAGGIPNDIARLAGPRFVQASETKQNVKLDTGVIKGLTGKGKITARFLRQEFFDFMPKFKLWLCANDAPEVPYDDDGMWRRVVRVPFDYVVPVEDRDLRVKQRLCDPRVSGAAILAWAVKGCLAWQRAGRLVVPAGLVAATEEYRQDNNDLREFFDDHYVFGAEQEICVSDLYQHYAGGASDYGMKKVGWADLHGIKQPMTNMAFTKILKKHGVSSFVKKVYGRSVRYYKGIGRLPHNPPPPPPETPKLDQVVEEQMALDHDNNVPF